MAAADGATHKTALLFSSGITQKTTIALFLLYNPGKAKGKGSVQRFATVYAVLLR